MKISAHTMATKVIGSDSKDGKSEVRAYVLGSGPSRRPQ